MHFLWGKFGTLTARIWKLYGKSGKYSFQTCVCGRCICVLNLKAICSVVMEIPRLQKMVAKEKKNNNNN